MMYEKVAVKEREKWIDYVKVIACILVVLGHFFQSMTKTNILPENNLYKWFEMTIYYFHVPLFFICSGYLYQKYSKVNSLDSWCKNILKKALALGVPYMTFSNSNMGTKKGVSSSVNDRIWRTRRYSCFFILQLHIGIYMHYSLFLSLHQRFAILKLLYLDWQYHLLQRF